MSSRRRPSKGTSRKRVILAIQTSRCSQVYSLGGHRKEGTRAPKKITLPKLKCLEDKDFD